MPSPRSPMSTLLAVCMTAVLAPCAWAGVPAIARLDARVVGHDLVVTAWYTDRDEARANPFAPDRDGGWAAQLLLATESGGQYLVDGVQCRQGEAPVLVLEPVFGPAMMHSRLVGDGRMGSQGYGLVTRIPLELLGGSAGQLQVRFQQYTIRDLGPGYNHCLQAEYVSEYTETMAAPTRGPLARVAGAAGAGATTDGPLAAARPSWGGLKSRYLAR